MQLNREIIPPPETYPVWKKLPLFSKFPFRPASIRPRLGPLSLMPLSLPTMSLPPRPSFCEFPHLIRAAAAAPKKCARRARITVIMHTMMVQRKDGSNSNEGKEGGLGPAKYGQMIMRCREMGKRRNLSQPKYNTMWIKIFIGSGWTCDCIELTFGRGMPHSHVSVVDVLHESCVFVNQIAVVFAETTPTHHSLQ